MVSRIATYIVLTFVSLPLLAAVCLSVTDSWFFPSFIGSITLEHYKVLWSGHELAHSTLVSLAIASTMSIASTFIGAVISVALHYGRHTTPRLLALGYFPYAIAPVVLGSMLQYYFLRLGLFGSLSGVLIAQSFITIPFAVLLFSTFWSDNVIRLSAQARTLGASTSIVIKDIIFPMSKRWIYLCLVQCFLISWLEYGLTRVIGAGEVRTLTVSIMSLASQASISEAAVACCLMLLPPSLIFMIQYRMVSSQAHL